MSRVFRSGLSRRESGSFSLRFGGAGEGENGSNEADSNSLYSPITSNSNQGGSNY